MPIVILLILGGLFLAASSKSKKKPLTPFDPDFWANPNEAGPAGVNQPGWPTSKSVTSRTLNGNPVGPIVELKPATDQKSVNLNALAGFKVPSIYGTLTAYGTNCPIYLGTLAKFASEAYKAEAAIVATELPPPAVLDYLKLIIVTSDGKFWYYGGTRATGKPVEWPLSQQYCAYHLSH